MSLTAEETAQLLEPGLKVDPNELDGGMQTFDTPAPGEDERSEHLQAAIDEFGEKVTLAAYKHGWKPKGEHKGSPDNFVDPIGFLERYAETADKRAKRQADEEAERRLKGIAETVKKDVEKLSKRIDKVDDADRAATKAHYKQLKKDALAAGDDAEYERLEAAEEKALADIDGAAEPAADNTPAPSVEADKLFAAFPHLKTPRTAAEKADQAWAAARADELEAAHPNATVDEVLRQIRHEMTSKAESTPAPKRGRTLSDDNALDTSTTSGPSDKVTVNNMTADQRNAYEMFVESGVYTDDAEGKQKYVDGLNQAIEDEAARYG